MDPPATFQENDLHSLVCFQLVKWMMEDQLANVFTIANEFQKLYFNFSEREQCLLDMSETLLNITDQDLGNPRESLITTRLTLFSDIIKYGTRCLSLIPRHIFNLLPRILNLWVHYSLHHEKNPLLLKYNEAVLSLAKDLPIYSFMPVLPLIISQIGIPLTYVSKVYNEILLRALGEYPQQVLWNLCILKESDNHHRKTWYQRLMEQAAERIEGIKVVEGEIEKFCKDLLRIGSVKEPSIGNSELAYFLPNYKGEKPLSIIMPTRSNLEMDISSAILGYKKPGFSPFPKNPATINRILPSVKVMRSMMRPCLLSFLGSDEKVYKFLCKPQDDLTKDACITRRFRFLNDKLDQDLEASRRHLHIRSYMVIPLNHECGIIEWVEGLQHLQGYIHEAYNARGKETLESNELKNIMDAVIQPGGHGHKDRIEQFKTRVLPKFPPVLDDWFSMKFPDPSHLLAARQKFTGTLAVMSMVGYVVGLGDRHAQNILLDEATGEVMHVDFGYLFELALELAKPEVVPFRLTQNMVSALGPSGTSGSFQKSCEITLRILRENKATILALLQGLMFDPIEDFTRANNQVRMYSAPVAAYVEFEAGLKKNPIHREKSAIKRPVNSYALWALQRVSDKLEGKSASMYPELLGDTQKVLRVEDQADQLISAAKDLNLLCVLHLG